MALIIDYLALCGLMFALVTTLYIGFKTIKLI